MWVGLLWLDYPNTQWGSSFDRNLLTAGITKEQGLWWLSYNLFFHFSEFFLLTFGMLEKGHDWCNSIIVQPLIRSLKYKFVLWRWRKVKCFHPNCLSGTLLFVCVCVCEHAHVCVWARMSIHCLSQMSVGYCTTCLTACQKSHWGQWNIELIQSMAGGILETVQIVAAMHNSSPVGKSLSLGCGVIPLFTKKLKSRPLVFIPSYSPSQLPSHFPRLLFLPESHITQPPCPPYCHHSRAV